MIFSCKHCIMYWCYLLEIRPVGWSSRGSYLETEKDVGRWCSWEPRPGQSQKKKKKKSSSFSKMLTRKSVCLWDTHSNTHPFLNRPLLFLISSSWPGAIFHWLQKAISTLSLFITALAPSQVFFKDDSTWQHLLCARPSLFFIILSTLTWIHLILTHLG